MGGAARFLRGKGAKADLPAVLRLVGVREADVRRARLEGDVAHDGARLW